MSTPSAGIRDRCRRRRANSSSRVAPGVFNRACAAKKPEVMLDHHRVLDADATFREDNIGLHISADITDKEVAEKARRKELRGWSFGFSLNPGGESWDDSAETIPTPDSDRHKPRGGVADRQQYDSMLCRNVGRDPRGRRDHNRTQIAVDEENETVDTDIRIKNELLARQFELFAERNMI